MLRKAINRFMHFKTENTPLSNEIQWCRRLFLDNLEAMVLVYLAKPKKLPSPRIQLGLQSCGPTKPRRFLNSTPVVVLQAVPG